MRKVRWHAALLCLAGGLCAAAGAILTALLAGAGARAWIPGVGAAALAAVLAVPLGFRGAAAFDRPLRDLLAAVRGWTGGDMASRLRLEPGQPRALRDLAQACNTLADAVEARLREQRRRADADAGLARQGAELAALQERQRIARDLHDAVSQRLFGIHLLAAAAARAPGAPQALAELEALSGEAQGEMRALLAQLRPPALATQSLLAALRGLCASTGRPGEPEWRLELVRLPGLGPAVEDGLYRVAQEAVANVQHHAAARRAVLSLCRRGDRVCLAVDDDGRGFTSAAGGAGMGLRGMEERVWALGGVLRVQSQPGRGTRVEAAIPLLRQPAAGPGQAGEGGGGG